MTVELLSRLKTTAAVVKYYNPVFGKSRPATHTSLMLLGLPDGKNIDVVWDDDDERYIVTTSRDNYQTLISRTKHKSKERTERAIEAIVNYYAAERTPWVSRLAPLLCLMLVGCGPMFSDGPAPIPQPQPTVEVRADRSLVAYGHGLADCFDRAAVRFRRHEPSIEIAEELGNSQKDARIASFLDMMQELADLNTPDEEQHKANDIRRAELCEKWAKELRGVK